MTTADDRARIDRLEREGDALRSDVADLTRRMARLEAFKERAEARSQAHPPGAAPAEKDQIRSST